MVTLVAVPIAARADVPPGGRDDARRGRGRRRWTGRRRRSCAPTAGASTRARLTDAELLRLAEESGEQIAIWDERPDKPYDRATTAGPPDRRRAGGARRHRPRCAALALLPDVAIRVRDAGRGGFIIDIRGARKERPVRVLIDGVSVSDPYYGTFDVSTIPITDIVEIRVSTSARVAARRPGRPRRRIEVHTRDAIGARLVAHAPGARHPAHRRAPRPPRRTALRPHLAIRGCRPPRRGGSASSSCRCAMATLGERPRATTGALRLEYRRGQRGSPATASSTTAATCRRQRRNRRPPPSRLHRSRDLGPRGRSPATSGGARSSSTAGPGPTAHRRRSRFRDAALREVVTAEDLRALRIGGTALATRPRPGSPAGSPPSPSITSAPPSTPPPPCARAGRGRHHRHRGRRAAPRYEDGPVRGGDGAGGLAIPLGLDAAPWPEAKVTGRWRGSAPARRAAGDGRAQGAHADPRERATRSRGRPELAPELATLGEVRLVATPRDGVALELSPYWRRSTGTVVAGADGRRGCHLGTTDVRGVDASARARVPGAGDVLELGGSASSPPPAPATRRATRGATIRSTSCPAIAATPGPASPRTPRSRWWRASATAARRSIG
ncbi:MAG: Plug domain-containing protein [Kofleriaceae bacterium]|nr:Plug domain-containing protein [Kofleriaceae bacterium]